MKHLIFGMNFFQFAKTPQQERAISFGIPNSSMIGSSQIKPIINIEPKIDETSSSKHVSFAPDIRVVESKEPVKITEENFPEILEQVEMMLSSMQMWSQSEMQTFTSLVQQIDNFCLQVDAFAQENDIK